MKINKLSSNYTETKYMLFATEKSKKAIQY